LLIGGKREVKQHTTNVAKIRTKQKIRLHKKKQFVVMKLR
jgi:hypothetical protein